MHGFYWGSHKIIAHNEGILRLQTASESFYEQPLSVYLYFIKPYGDIVRWDFNKKS